MIEIQSFLAGASIESVSSTFEPEDLRLWQEAEFARIEIPWAPQVRAWRQACRPNGRFARAARSRERAADLVGRDWWGEIPDLLEDAAEDESLALENNRAIFVRMVRADRRRARPVRAVSAQAHVEAWEAGR